jgi:hypothetical protein
VERVVLLMETPYKECEEGLRYLIQYIINDAPSMMAIHQPKIEFVLQQNNQNRNKNGSKGVESQLLNTAV